MGDGRLSKKRKQTEQKKKKKKRQFSAWKRDQYYCCSFVANSSHYKRKKCRSAFWSLGKVDESTQSVGNSINRHMCRICMYCPVATAFRKLDPSAIQLELMLWILRTLRWVWLQDCNWDPQCSAYIHMYVERPSHNLRLELKVTHTQSSKTFCCSSFDFNFSCFHLFLSAFGVITVLGSLFFGEFL